MIIIELIYKVELTMIEQHIIAHREFLEHYYQQNYFLASGPKVPRDGGIIIALKSDLPELEKIMAQDPFHIHKLVDYQYTVFNPVKFHPVLQSLIDK